jgi:hypothetical protein
MFPYHSEYLDINFFEKLKKFDSKANDQKINILSFAGANFFRPISIGEDSSIFYTKTENKTATQHLDSLKKLCVPYYRGNLCDEITNKDYKEIKKNELKYNKKNYFPVCGHSVKITEKELFSEENLNLPTDFWGIYGGEYAESDCKNHKILMQVKINNKKFDLLTIHKTKNLIFLNANTNGIGVNFFSSNSSKMHLKSFLNNKF